jgi:L-lysine 6-transaminase
MTEQSPALTRAIQLLEQHMTMARFSHWLDLDRSEGSWLRTAQGEELLDCCCAFGSLPLGWNHPALIEPAFQRHLGLLAASRPALCATLTPHVAEFVETFYRVGIPPEMKWIFFVDGGSLAVENALKAAFDWKVQKNLAAGRGELGSRVLHFERCFHGRSGYTMSLTDSPDPRKTRWFPQFDWPRVPPPPLRFPVTAEVVAEVEAAERESIRRIEAEFDAHPHDIAAIIIEPIQAEGGDRHFRTEFFAALRRIADEREALLIYDEVQTGVATSGAFWAWQKIGVQPDVLAFGKKAQVCGIIAGPRLDEVERHVLVEPSRVNTTFGGNLVDMARFQRVLEVIEQEDLVGNADRVGARFLQELQGLCARMGGWVDNPRGMGLMLAIDVPDTAARNAGLKACRAAGLFPFGCGTRSIRFRPTLTFTEELAVEAVRRLEIALRQVRDAG